MWWVFFILFFLISVVSSILLYFSLRRINQYEELIVQFQQIITFSTEKMKVADSKGHYESDDETGFFFVIFFISFFISLDDIFEEENINVKKNK